MKKLIIALALAFCSQSFNAGPIVIKGRAYIRGNTVWCGGGSRLCAVIPRVDDNGPADCPGVITIYGEGEEVLEQHTYSDITVEEDSGGTLVTWIP